MAPPTTKLAKAQLDLREPVKDGKHYKPGSSLKVVTFDFNPKDYSTALPAGWNFKPTKKPGGHPEFTGTQLRTMDVEMFLDTTDEDTGDVSATIETLLTTVRPTAKSTSANAPFPPIVVFSWGTSAPFVAVVKSVASTLSLFRPDGTPVRGHMQDLAAGVSDRSPQAEPDIGCSAQSAGAPCCPR